MAINTEIYGTKDQWYVYGTIGSGFSAKNLPRFVNFTGKNDGFTNVAQLSAGRTAGKVQLNTPIDKSIALIGVDDNSSLVHQTWHKRGASTDLTENFKVHMTKNGTNPLAWSRPNTSWTNRDNICTLQAYGNYNSWAYNQTYRSENPDIYQAPCSAYPMNAVHVICVRAYTKVYDGQNDASYIDCDLHTYFNGHTTNDETSPKWVDNFPVIHCIYIQTLYRNDTTVTDPDSRTTFYRGGGGSIYIPRPIILNEIEPFTDPDDPETQYRLLHYSQPTMSATNVSNIRFLNVYDSTDYLGSTYSTDRYPTLLFGSIAYPDITASGSGSTYDKYYYGLVGHEDKLHTMFFNYPNGVRHWTWYSTLDDFGGADGFREYCRRQCAYLGGFFSESFKATQVEPNLDSDYFFLGIIDDNGVTHGDYSQGKANRDQKQWNWEDFNENNFDPDKKPEAPDKERESVDYRTQNLYIGLETGNYYALTAHEIKQLLAWCNKIVAPEGKFTVDNPAEGEYTYQELSDQLRQLFNGAYPNDQIISLMYFPFDIENNLNTAIKTNGQIQLANTSTKALTGWFGSDIPEVTATKIAGGTQFAVFETEPYLIEQYYGDFRDFAPYTAMSVTVPYHGSVPINAGEWYGHSLKIRVSVDIITGSSVAFIYRDNAVTATISGQVGVPIQLVIRNVGDFTTAIINGNQMAIQQNANLTKNLTGLLASVVTGTVGGATGNATMVGAGVMGAVNSLASTVTTEKQYQNTVMSIEHTQASNTLVSVVSPSASMCQDIRPMLQIVYPRLMTGYNSSVYGRTVGFACEIQGSIGSFSGYSVFAGANLDGVNAPDTEKNMIFQKLQGGIII